MSKKFRFKILIIIIAQLLLGNLYINAQTQSIKPTITKEMCIKLWYGCQRYDMANAIFYHSMGKNNIIENDRLMDSMKNGNKEVGEKFIRIIQNLYGREDAWATFKNFGFNHNELEIANDLYSYYTIQENTAAERKQQQQYNDWLKNGVPSNINPDIKARLYCNDPNYVISFFNENPELFKGGPYKIKVSVGPDKSISLWDTNKPEAALLYPYLHIDVKEPAYVKFNKIDNMLPVESIVEINLDIKMHQLSSCYDQGEFEASTKFDKKNNKWVIKITDEYINQFEKIVGKSKDLYMESIENAIIQLEKAPKKYIKFKLYDVDLEFTYKGNKNHGTGNYSLLYPSHLNPIAIITESQNAFSRFKSIYYNM